MSNLPDGVTQADLDRFYYEPPTADEELDYIEGAVSRDERDRANRDMYDDERRDDAPF